MWNNPQAAALDDPTASRPTPGGGPPRPAAQAARLADEWRRLQRAFAYHPHVTVTPQSAGAPQPAVAPPPGGSADVGPPASYRIDFRVQTLVVNPQTSQLEYAAAATMDLSLPPGFPAEAPVVRPVTPVFHPNVCYDGVSLENLWHPNDTLVALVRTVGEVLAYRKYDAAYAVNPAAVDWLTANHAHTPTDRQSNLAPTAGGEPLSRVLAYGQQSLDSLKQTTLATQSSLLGSVTPPDAAAVRAEAERTRLALALFLEPDVPEAMRRQAADLSRAAAGLVEALPAYAFARDRRRRAAAVRQGVKQLAAATEPLAAEVAALAALADAAGVDDAMAALRLIPESGKLQPVQLALPKRVAEAGRAAAALSAARQALVSLTEPSPAAGEPDPLTGPRLAAELAAGAADAEAATREAFEALLAAEPAVRQAAAEADALEVAARWREYLDMAGKARAMERQVRDLGAEGLQAFFVRTAAGRFGPYQFEQSVDLGGGDVVVRSLGGKAFEVRDVRADRSLGGSKAGTAVLALPASAEASAAGHAPASADPAAAPPDGASPATFPARFTVTERCDDLIVLLEFLRRSTIETVQKFAAYNGAAQTWTGQVCRVLARPDVRKALEEELAKAARRWRHTIVDLAALGPWKERLATYFLVHRSAEAVPPMVADITDAKQKHRASRKRLDAIMAKAGRDPATGSLVIPPNQGRQYNEELALQARCATTAQTQTVRLKSLVSQLTARLQSPKLLGKGVQPQLRVVSPLPEVLATLDVSDGTIGSLVAPVEELVQVPLGGPQAGAADVEGGHGGSAHQHAIANAEHADTQGAEAIGTEAEPFAAEDAGTEGFEAERARAEGVGPEGVEAADAESAVATASAGDDHAADAVAATEAAAPAGVPETEWPKANLGDSLAAEGSAAETTADAHGATAGPADDGDPAAESDWVIDDDESEPADYSADEYAQTDVAFGFDPAPSPPANRPPAGN
jgi:hypothetical protein